MQFRDHLAQIVSQLEPEHRLPVAEALRASGDDVMQFQQELQSQTWEHPDLPVDTIMNQIMVDH